MPSFDSTDHSTGAASLTGGAPGASLGPSATLDAGPEQTFQPTSTSGGGPTTIAVGTGGSTSSTALGTTGGNSAGTTSPSLDAGVATGSDASVDADGASVEDATSATDPTPECDRACLLEVLQRYVEALTAQDASMLEVSSDLVYTENGVVAELGQTVWQMGVAVQPGARLDFADPVTHNVASHFWFKKDDGSDSIYQVRLRVDEGLITEIEALAIHSLFEAANFFFSPANMKPEPIFLEPVAPEDRLSRDELIALTHLYIDHLEGKSGAEIPFAEGCKRYENGIVTADGAGAFAAQSWFFEVTRRIPVVDEEAQITWGMLPFFQSESTLVVGEAFKFVDDEIAMIQAVMGNQPIGPFANDDVYTP